MAENSDDHHPKVLIEEWFPFKEVGIECERERGQSSALPPINYLHVWWARRPLIVCKAAILSSIISAETDHDSFTQELMGFSPTLIQEYDRILTAKRNKQRIKNPFRK